MVELVFGDNGQQARHVVGHHIMLSECHLAERLFPLIKSQSDDGECYSGFTVTTEHVDGNIVIQIERSFSNDTHESLIIYQLSLQSPHNGNIHDENLEQLPAAAKRLAIQWEGDYEIPSLSFGGKFLDELKRLWPAVVATGIIEAESVQQKSLR